MSGKNDAPRDVDTILLQLSPEAQRALAALHELATRAAEAARPMLAMAAHAAASLAPLRGVLHDIGMKLRPALEFGWLESFQQRMQAVATGLQSVEAAMKNAEDIGRMGWTFPMNASLRDCVDLLLEAPNGPEATDAAFARFYADNEKQSLLLLLADLRQHERLSEFGALIEEIAFGLDHEKYRLAVTALLPLFEGVARSCWVDGFWQGTARDRFFEGKIAASTHDSFDRIVWSATRAFVGRLYEKNFQGDPKPTALNRHWILHGRGPADASLVDALRLLQGVHTVVSLADEEARDAAPASQASE
jgi:hypothetical protein